jgi:hypothetical protein
VLAKIKFVTIPMLKHGWRELCDVNMSTVLNGRAAVPNERRENGRCRVLCNSSNMLSVEMILPSARAGAGTNNRDVPNLKEKRGKLQRYCPIERHR